MIDLSNKFLFAGLDFLIDQKGNLVFIEANSAPGLMYRYNELYGECTPLVKLTEALATQLVNKKLILVYSKNFFESKPNVRFKYEELLKLTGGKCQLCLLDKADLKDFSDKLFDEKGKEIKSGIVSTSWLFLKKELGKNNAFSIVNPYIVSNLTTDKFKTSHILKNSKNFYVPTVFEFKTKAELEKIVAREKFLTGFVIKPNGGYGGKNIYFVDNLEEIEEIDFSKDEWLVQEKIEINKDNDKYWDIRVFVVDGKYCGALKRTSQNQAVNVSLGGEVKKIPKDLEEKLKLASEECVSKINKNLFKKDAF